MPITLHLDEDWAFSFPKLNKYYQRFVELVRTLHKKQAAFFLVFDKPGRFREFRFFDKAREELLFCVEGDSLVAAEDSGHSDFLSLTANRVFSALLRPSEPLPQMYARRTALMRFTLHEHVKTLLQTAPVSTVPVPPTPTGILPPSPG